MTADRRDGSAGGRLSSLLVRWLLGVAGTYSESLAVLASATGKLPVLLKVPGALRSLDLTTRIIAIACLVLLAALVGATRLFSEAPDWLATLSWTDGDQSVRLARAALYLSLLGWAVSAAVIVAGASQWNLAALVLAGVVPLFAVVFIGFAGGKAYALAAPSWLLPVLAATSPAVARRPAARVVGIVLLAALATWHTYLFTPLSAQGRPPRWGWLAALLVVSAPLLLRLPRRVPLWGAFALALAVNGGVFLHALGAGETALARGMVIPTSFLVGLFAAMWFVLGGELVAGGVSAANTALKVGAATVRRRFLPVVVMGLCVLEVGLAPWMLDRLSTPGALTLSVHRWLALVLALIGGVLTVRRRLTSGWARTLLVVWAFGLTALRSYFSDLTDLAAYAEAREVKRLALTLFTFAMAMQVIRLLIDKPAAGARNTRARLCLLLGALTFLATGTQFEFAVENTGVLREAAAFQFAGATALFLPLVLALLVKEQRWLPAPPPALLLRSFVVGFVGAFAVQLVRIATQGPGGWSLAAHLGTVALADAMKACGIAALIVSAGAVGRLAAPAVGVACALGFAAGYAQNLTVLMLDAAGKIVLLLTVRSGAISEALSGLVAGYVRMNAALPAADHYHLVVASVLPAALIGWGVAKGVREGRPVAGALAVAGGLGVSVGVAWALHGHPLLTTESRQPIPVYLVLTDASALAPLLLSVLGLVTFLYLAVWRPARAAPAVSAEARPEVGGSMPRRRWAVAAGIVTPVVVIGALGLGLAWRAPSPMEEYRDPAGRFVIDYPRSWRIERRPSGETVFYRDDPVLGVLMLVHPGVALPGWVSPAQLVQGLDRQIRTVYPDARVTATRAASRTDGDRSIQRLELTVVWTGPDRRRLRSQSTVTLVSAVENSRFSYVTYQVPAPAPRSLEPLLSRAVHSYRPGVPD